jgi:hypothetical protein
MATLFIYSWTEQNGDDSATYYDNNVLLPKEVCRLGECAEKLETKKPTHRNAWASW